MMIGLDDEMTIGLDCASWIIMVHSHPSSASRMIGSEMDLTMMAEYGRWYHRCLIDDRVS